MDADEERVLAEGMALMSQERWFDAIQVFRSALSDVASSWRVAWNLGWAYYKVDDLENAIASLNRSTERAPERAVTWWALGAVQEVGGYLTDAENNLRKSLALNDSGQARQSLALVLMKMKRWDEAEAVHVDGIKLRPQASARWKAYGAFLSDRGRREEALTAYRNYRDLRSSKR